MIVKAEPQDCNALTILTKKSKAYWGYSEELLAQWDAQLTITADYISNNAVYKLVADGSIIGYYSLLKSDTDTIRLDNLFIDPDYIGKGHGKALMHHAISQARVQNYSAITLDADPNAESFYKNFGFNTISQIATSMPDRFLPVMQLSLQPAPLS